MALTTEAVRKRKPTDTRQEIADKAGLYLVIQPSGVKSWAFRGRVNGRPKNITLGTFPGVDLTAARDLAGAARKAAHAGVVFAPPEPSPDPEAAPATPEGRSVSEVWKQYRALRLEPECRETTVAEHARIFQNHIEPLLGSRDIGTIAKTDLLPIADAALVRGFEARNKTVAVMTGFFGWCHEERDLIDKSPLRGLKQRSAKQTNGLKRALADAEIKAFWKACDAIDGENLSSTKFGAMFKLLLLTGARRNQSSRPGEFHPQALTDPDVNVSAHPALTVQPPSCAASANGPTAWGCGKQCPAPSALPVFDVAADVCISTSPIARDIGRDGVVSGKAPICSTDHSSSSSLE